MNKPSHFLPKITAVILITALTLTTTFCIIFSVFPSKHIEDIKKYCDEYDVDVPLVLSLIKAESNFNKNAKSKANAVGLMQLTEETFDYCTKNIYIDFSPDILNPNHNIHAGVWYLSKLLERYDGNVKNAVAAYNAGASNVDKWLKNQKYSKDGKSLDTIPFGETDRHAEKIQNYIKIYSILYPHYR